MLAVGVSEEDANPDGEGFASVSTHYAIGEEDAGGRDPGSGGLTGAAVVEGGRAFV